MLFLSRWRERPLAYTKKSRRSRQSLSLRNVVRNGSRNSEVACTPSASASCATLRSSARFTMAEQPSENMMVSVCENHCSISCSRLSKPYWRSGCSSPAASRPRELLLDTNKPELALLANGDELLLPPPPPVVPPKKWPSSMRRLELAKLPRCSANATRTASSRSTAKCDMAGST